MRDLSPNQAWRALSEARYLHKLSLGTSSSPRRLSQTQQMSRMAAETRREASAEPQLGSVGRLEEMWRSFKDKSIQECYAPMHEPNLDALLGSDSPRRKSNSIRLQNGRPVQQPKSASSRKQSSFHDSVCPKPKKQLASVATATAYSSFITERDSGSTRPKRIAKTPQRAKTLLERALELHGTPRDVSFGPRRSPSKR